MLYFCRVIHTMQLLKEVSFDAKYTGAAKLENGTIVLVHEDGHALGMDGKTYYRVSREVETEPAPIDPLWLCCDPDAEAVPDIILEDIGWTSDADHVVVLPIEGPGGTERG